jgi:pimeloyl-ACP methyl ester carboxylesterase
MPRLGAHAVAVSVTAATLAVAAAQPASAAPRLRACPDPQPGFGCGTLAVPLDHAAAGGEQLRLRFAARRRAPAGGRLLIALSGGPGQSAVPAASAFAAALQPALRRYRLVVLDQRGTGAGALSCPSVQGLRSLDPFRPEDVAACAQRIGPRRAFFSTADTVLDLERLRAAFGARRVALMGISYGTHVALQYARAFPARVDRLILDSIVGPDGPDTFFLDSVRALPRVLREQCAGRRCAGITSDPVADVAALAGRLAAGPIAGRVYDGAGRRARTSYRSAEELFYLLLAGDLNPYLQAALPGALAAARRGDASLLLRLRRVGQGAGTALRDLSFGLNVTTGCLDAPLPYALDGDPGQRTAPAAAALAAVPPADLGPFDAATVLRTSYADDCLGWPADVRRPAFTGPLPDVPALLLGGRLDVRTPAENALATAQQLRRAAVVTVAGTGHDTVDTDLTGCVELAVERFIRGRTVGRPCRGRTNAVRPFPRPPRSLGDFRAAPGVDGTRGRAVYAVLDTLLDARVAALQAVLSGLRARGGGLHGGRYDAGSGLDGRLRLRRYSYLSGLRVSGRVDDETGQPVGTVRVSGPRGTSGVLRLDARGGATGRLGGRAVRFRGDATPAVAAAVADAPAGSRRADGASFGRLPAPERRRLPRRPPG